ncbi:MAG: rhomboid family intramembrane serine protease [Pseudomonas sp.]|uniref:rhomboid family intramembrane serine protease n=1 Tax=Pseudomonas sp. TaxID=306 RepID=UPI0030F017D0
MSPVEVLRLPVSVDLSAFIQLLQRLQVPHRVSEESGEQVLWVPGEQLAADIRGLYQQYPEGDPEQRLELPAPQQTRTGGFVQQLRHSPLTALVLLLTLLVAGITLLGDNFDTIRWLSWMDFHVQGDYATFVPWSETLAAGQYWRLITPIFIHFGILHLAMNSMWYWELGRRIESYQGKWMLLGLTLLVGLVSNAVQFWWAGPSIFGGLSGVLYGLLGHCWIYQLLAPNRAYHLPKGVVVMMLIWLVICMSGITEVAGIGAIANGAHVGGLLVGCLTGLLGGALARRRR